MSLFRAEAIEFQRYRQLGNTAAVQPFWIGITAWFLIISTAAILAFLCIAQYSRKETAVGYLTPSSGTSKVFAPRRGTIKAVHVKEGDTVAEGQPLLTVDTDQIAEDGVDVNATMLDTLTAQKKLLHENIEAEERRAGSEKERLSSLQRGLETELSQIQNQTKLQQERVKVAQSELDAADQLHAKGYMTAVELKRRQVQVLDQKQSISSLNQQLAARQNQLTETRFNLQQLPTMMAQKVQALRNELATADQRIAEIHRRRAYVVRAPSDGRVTSLQATGGQDADPQRLQLEIVPADAVLRGELFPPARAIGFIQAGQAVRILYDAFPYQ